ncbi:hypothetical protein AB6A40_004401 [Gnathostoma spinigerum]|uniref:G-protein coupled receptors family 1 profile domain-containing protein n=1 Tax=Gnathostoma spinigerum TaxID=75299 RepID=A0ABD6EM97_9BILA
MDDADNERPRKPRLVNRISRAFRLGDSQSCLLYQKSPFHVQKTTNIGVRRAPTVSRQNTVPYEKAREAENSTENNYAPLLKAHKLRSTHSEKAILAKQRVIRMLIVIVIIFFCCWTPNYIWWLILTAQDSFQLFDVWNSQVNTAITVLCYIPSCANPITYCFLNKKFRTALLLSFGCIRSPLRNRFHTVYLPKIDQTNITSKEYPSNGRQHLQRTHNCRHTVNETNGINTANDLRSSLYRSIPVLYQQRSFDVNANKAVDTPNVEKRRADSMKIRRDCCDSFSKMDYFNEEEERGLKKILNETNI